MSPYHEVHWLLNEHGGVTATFTCSAPDTEVCRLTCTGSCETLPCEHAVVAEPGRCLFVDWYDASGDEPAEFYAGETRAPLDGPVEPEWQGDYYTWQYVPEPAAAGAGIVNHHIGRSWSGHPIEDECPCPQEPCGLVDSNRTDLLCPHHSMAAGKTIRQMHAADRCPASGDAS